MANLLSYINLFLLQGLNNVKSDMLSNWIQPIFIIVVAFFVVKFVKDRQFRELAAFIVIAAIVGLFVYTPEKLVGGEKGTLTKSADNLVKKVSTIDTIDVVTSFTYDGPISITE